MASKAIDRLALPLLSRLAGRRWQPPLAAGLAGGSVWAVRMAFPQVETEVLARGAAWLAALMSGSGLTRGEEGWLFDASGLPIVVTQACSGADFHLMVTVLCGWQLARCGMSFGRALLTSLSLALPLSVAVNALRISVLAQAHRWVMPRFPEVYGAILHLLFGVAVFLPALIALNLLLESHARRRSFAATSHHA